MHDAEIALYHANPDIPRYHRQDLTGHDPYNSADDGNFMTRLVYGDRDPEIHEIAP
jgi:hypothetical protein